MQHKQNKLQKSRRLCNDTDKGVTKKYIDKIFNQQMTFLCVYQSQTEFVKIRWYNCHLVKCDAFENAKDNR